MSLVAKSVPTVNTLDTPVEFKKTTRLREISFLQTFGIILVVLGHSHPLYVTFPRFYRTLYEFIFSFHMPLFMCISGFLFIYTGGIKTGYTQFLANKALRLLLPYIALSSIIYLPKTMLLDYAARSVDLNFMGFAENLIYPRDNVLGHFWFLPTLFLVFVISPILQALIRKQVLAIAATIALIVVNVFNPISFIRLFNVGEAAQLLIYFWAGCLVAYYINTIKKFMEHKHYLPPLLAIATFFLPLGIATGIAGILMSFSIALVYIGKKNTFLKFLDGYSYQIYLISWPIQAVVYVLLYHKMNFDFYTTAIFMLVTGLILPVVIAKLTVRFVPPLKKLIGM